MLQALYVCFALVSRSQVLVRARGGRIFALVDAAAHTADVSTCYRFTFSNAR